MNLWTIDAKGNLATLGEWPDRGRETMKAFNRSGAVAGIFTTADGVLLSTLNNPNARQLDALKRFAHAVLTGAFVPPPAEVCPSPTLPPAPPPTRPVPPPPAPREPAPVRQLPVRPRPAPAPPAPPPAAATAAPATDLDKALAALARVREELETDQALLRDVVRHRDALVRERDALRTRVTDLETLSRRAAEFEAIAAEATAHADAAGVRAERLALELAVANATAQSALAALARETARADGLVADLARRDNSPRVLAAVAARRVRVAVPRAPQHPMAAIADHLRRRASR